MTPRPEMPGRSGVDSGLLSGRHNFVAATSRADIRHDSQQVFDVRREGRISENSILERRCRDTMRDGEREQVD